MWRHSNPRESKKTERYTPKSVRVLTLWIDMDRVRKSNHETRRVAGHMESTRRTNNKMSITITDYTMHCGNGPHCRHRICEDCGDPMRSAHHKIADHPGTRQIATKTKCHRCQKKHRSYEGGNILTPADLEDQRHILLTDAEMDRMSRVSPEMHDWHIKRRKRLKLGQYRTR